MSTSSTKWYNLIYLPRYTFLIFTMVAMIAVSMVVGYLTPQYIAKLFKAVDQSDSEFYSVLYAFIAIIVVEYFASVIYQLSVNKYLQHLVIHVREFSFSKWLNSYEVRGNNSEKYPLGEILSRIMNDTEALMELVGSGSFKIIIDLVYIVSCLVSFITLNSRSGFFLISAEVIVLLLLYQGSKSMGKVYLSVQKANGVMARALASCTNGIRKIFFTPHFNFASKKSLASFENFLEKQLRANVWDASFFSVAESLYPLLLLLLVLIFPYSQITEMATLAAIVDLIQRSINPIKELSSKISGIQRARSGLIRIQEFNHDLDKLPQGKEEVVDYQNRLELKQFHIQIPRFEYPRANVEERAFSLQDIDLQASGGELIGIVGLSGSGKSTLFKILAADLFAKNSSLKLDFGTEAYEFNGEDFEQMKNYKKSLSIITQDSHVFSETLKFNITLGHLGEQSVEAFWQQVQIEIPYVQGWEIDLETVLDPKALSMGQKQLIALLRSVYLPKPVVLLDEISSGLDSELEMALRKLILMIQSQSLTMIVAHRLETITNANAIWVMKEGRVVDVGTHSELLGSSTVYSEFIRLLNQSN